jgi:hypothetical protein
VISVSQDYYPADPPSSTDTPQPDAPAEPDGSAEQHRGRLIDYDQANVVTPMIQPPQPRLVVDGHKPRPGMEVALMPVTYIQQPEFWEIHVLGSPGAAPPYGSGGPPGATQLPAEPPVATQLPAESTAYSVHLDLAACTGTIGIEVVGANQRERMVVYGPAAETE